ncbi:hypothetical protein [Streptosporangium vulgare]|uniref:hypothetical protein n=1 Tax=Streptosporangium vulgare TaxID=46190 RepID=UPI0031E337EF
MPWPRRSGRRRRSSRCWSITVDRGPLTARAAQYGSAGPDRAVHLPGGGSAVSVRAPAETVAVHGPAHPGHQHTEMDTGYLLLRPVALGRRQ